VPSRHEIAGRPRETDPFMATVMLGLVVLVSIVLSLAAGMAWHRLLHWTGELLLVVGVLLAAKGISDVRREWTSLPGIRTSAILKVGTVRKRVVAFLWLLWNRSVERWPRVARRLGARIHLTHIHAQDVSVFLDDAAAAIAEAHPGGVVITGGDAEQRLSQLEKRMAGLEAELSALDAWRKKDAEVSRAETAQERADRMAADERIRKEMADLVGGGLRLQVWGVICLLIGTVLTAYF
jgi:hypothetical protein